MNKQVPHKVSNQRVSAKYYKNIQCWLESDKHCDKSTQSKVLFHIDNKFITYSLI